MSNICKIQFQKDIRRDEKGGRKRVEEHLELEVVLNRANCFAAYPSLPSSDSSQFKLSREEDVDDSVIQELRALFQLIDLNGNEKLSCIELVKLFDSLCFQKDYKHTLHRDVFERLLQGKLDFQTFVTALNNCSNKNTQYSEEGIIRAFQYFGKDTGEISGEDLLQLLQSYDGKWNKKTAISMMKNTGLSTTKNIDFGEFISTIHTVWACTNASEVLHLSGS